MTIFRVTIENEMESEIYPEELARVTRVPTTAEAEALLRRHWAWICEDDTLDYYRKKAGKDADNPKFKESSNCSEDYYEAWLHLGIYNLSLYVVKDDSGITTWNDLISE
jgi:hypothetical protein